MTGRSDAPDAPDADGAAGVTSWAKAAGVAMGRAGARLGVGWNVADPYGRGGV